MKRIFTTPLGASFPKTVVAGFLARYADRPPQDMAKTICLVGTARLADMLREEFITQSQGFLPKFVLLSDLSALAPDHLGQATSQSLHRIFEFMPHVDRLIKAPQSVLSGASLFAMTQSLDNLFEEMINEGVTPDQLHTLNVDDAAGYWQSMLAFVKVIEEHYVSPSAETTPARKQRALIDALHQTWLACEDRDPIYVIGSTGSRGPTRAMMSLLADHPDGGVILPAVDLSMRPQDWNALAAQHTAHDHPQFRFARFCADHNVTPDQLEPWDPAVAPRAKSPALSLALCPAPVTSSWRKQGPAMGPLSAAFTNTALVETRTIQEEALCLALILRDAAHSNTSTTMITPDRDLVRRVQAYLDRWDIRPDDSAGTPLSLSAPGRFLRHILDLLISPPEPSAVFALLKHPITHSHGARNEHLLRTRDLELALRRRKMNALTPAEITQWAAARDDAGTTRWAAWLCETFLSNHWTEAEDWISSHQSLAHRIAAGSTTEDPTASGELWQEVAGQKSRAVFDQLQDMSTQMSQFSASDYRDVFTHLLAQDQVRQGILQSHHIRIWGTQESRLAYGDQIILAGLNEGVWPSQPAPDPWLSREMRAQLGLLSPEQNIGLSAHDFQHAASFDTVILSRATMDAESQTVPSRWLNRLMNLLDGLKPELNSELDGPEVLDQMRERGHRWMTIARDWQRQDVRTPHQPEQRRSVSPPIHTRPRKLSITEIQTLIRDPYAIYAKHILGLKPLEPFHQLENYALRGTVLHKVMERAALGRISAPDALITLAHEVFEEYALTPEQTLRWHVAFEKNITHISGFLEQSYQEPTTIICEANGALTLEGIDFTLSGKIDRIDQLPGGAVAIYDYKSGSPPSEDQQKHFDRQLFLSAAIVDQKGVENLITTGTQSVGYVSILKTHRPPTALIDTQTSETCAQLTTLISHYATRTQGYTARRALETTDAHSDYNGVSRFGEWSIADDATLTPIGGDDG